MTIVTAKALQRRFTPQTSTWSMLAFQDNPLMPVINSSFFQQKVGATFTRQHWRKDRWKRLIHSTFSFQQLFFFIQSYQLKYRHTLGSLLDCFAKGHSCLHNVDQLVMAGYVMPAAASFQTALVAPSPCQLQGWDTGSFGSSVFIKQHGETLLF